MNLLHFIDRSGPTQNDGLFHSRRITIAYVLALSMIGLLSFGAHMFVLKVITQQEKSSSVINLSGRQAMLSQRVAFFAGAYAISDTPQNRTGLREAIGELATAHERLSHGDETRGIPKPDSPQLQTLYFTPNTGIDSLVKKFLNDAKVLAAMQSDRHDLMGSSQYNRLVMLASDDLLNQLSLAVQEYERENNRALARLRTTQDIMLAVLGMVLILEALLIFRPLVRQLVKFALRLTQMAMYDTLTGLLNRRALADATSRLAALQQRRALPLCVLMMDIDHFKNVNDTHGHAVGDLALQHIAKQLQSFMRTEDCVARWGGEEFIVVLAGATLPAAIQVAERIRACIAATPVPLSGQQTLPLTLSIGVSDWSPCDGDDFEAAVSRADNALYRAKAEGRNTVQSQELQAVQPRKVVRAVAT
ncbi:MAG: diguanylate cyclase [Burkholderiaceae bacterium]